MRIQAIEVVGLVAPNAREEYLHAIREGGLLFKEHSITTTLRMAHFLTQALHETGGFTILRENMNYSAKRLIEIFGDIRNPSAVTQEEAAELAGKPEKIAERVYGLGWPHKAEELGNIEVGDGFRYRGNGMLQTTGRGNHRRLGAACDVDFEGHPELVTVPEHALKPALLEWTEGRLNALADKNNIRAITKRINGRWIGLDERQKWFDTLWPLLRDDCDPLEPLVAATEDDDVKWLQEALNNLGADPRLVVDGCCGPATRKAVEAFQAAARIVVDGIAGPVTRAAIQLKLDTIKGV